MLKCALYFRLVEELIAFIIEILAELLLQFFLERVIYPFFRLIGFLVRLIFNFKNEKRIVLRVHPNNGMLGFVTVFFGLIILIPVVVYAVNR